MSAGDYRLFRSENAENRGPETGGQFAKARHWRAFRRASWPFYLDAVLAGWGGRIRTSAWWNQNPSDGGSLGTSRTSWTQVSCNKSGGDTVATRLKSKKAAPKGGF